MSNINTVLNKGEYYTTIRNGDFFVDVYKHATAPYLYVVELNSYEHTLTTVVQKQKYRKELNELFFNPIANEIWNEQGIIDKIKSNRVAIDGYIKN